MNEPTSGKLAVRCACGAKGWVDPRKAAGRRMRCPLCMGVMELPAPARPPALVASAAAAGTPASGLDLLPEPELDLLPAPEDPGQDPAPGHAPAPTTARDRPRRRRRSTRTPAGSRSAPGEGRRDVAQEAHLRAIAFWPLLSGSLGILAVLALMAMATLAGAAPGPLLLTGALLGGVAALNLGVGLSLWTYQGWARWVMVLVYGVAILGALASLLGDAPGAAKLGALCHLMWLGAIEWVLLSEHTTRVCSPAYRRLVTRTPGTVVPFWQSVFFWLPALIIAASLALVFLAFGGTLALLLAR